MATATSDLPAGLGAPPSTETLQGTADPNGERSKIAQAPSPQTRTSTRLGVCPTLWPMLQPPQTSRPHLGTRFPAQTNQSHARFPILKKSYAGVSRTSASKSTAPRTHTHRHSTRTSSWAYVPTHHRLKLRRWRDKVLCELKTSFIMKNVRHCSPVSAIVSVLST